MIDVLRDESMKSGDSVLVISAGGHYYPTLLSLFGDRAPLYVSLGGFDLTLVSIYDFAGPPEQFFSPLLTGVTSVVSNIVPSLEYAGERARSLVVDAGFFRMGAVTVGVLSMFPSHSSVSARPRRFGRHLSLAVAVDGGVARARARGAGFVVVIFQELTLEDVEKTLLPLVYERIDLVVATMTSEFGTATGRTSLVSRWLDDNRVRVVPGVGFNEQDASEGFVFFNVSVAAAAPGNLPSTGFIDLKLLGSSVPQHPQIFAELTKVQAPFAEFFRQVAFTAPSHLAGGSLCRKGECAAGRYIVSAVLEWGRSAFSFESLTPSKAVIGLQNAGGIRGSLGPGNVTVSQLQAAAPFPNKVVMVRTTGSAVANAIRHSFSRWSNLTTSVSGDGRFLCVAGIRFTFSVTLNLSVAIEVDTRTSLGWAPLAMDDIVDVVTHDFFADGGDGQTFFASAPRVSSVKLVSDAAREQSQRAAPGVAGWDTAPLIVIKGEALPIADTFCAPGSQLSVDSLQCLPCSPGFFRPKGAEKCLPCAKGSFAPSSGMTHCLSCPANSRLASDSPTTDRGSISLSACLCVEGYTRATVAVNATTSATGSGGQNFCERCPSTSFSTFGSGVCTACPANSRVNPLIAARGSPDDCLCDEGFYKFSSFECRLCPDGGGCANPENGLPRRGYYLSRVTGQVMVCPEGARCDGMRAAPVALPGRWTAVQDGEAVSAVEPIFLRCASFVACPGGLSGGTCPKGYKNKPMCTQCEPGYYLFSGACWPCGQGGVKASLRLPIGVLALLVIFAYFTRKSRSAGVPGRPIITSIASEFFQGMFVLGRIRQVYPPTVNNAMQILSLPFSLNVEHLAVECYVRQAGFRAKWAMVMLVPVGLALCFVLAGLVGALVRRRSWRSGHLTDLLIDGYLRVFSAFYLVFAVEAMSPLSCTKQPDGTWSLDADPVLPCFNGWWWRLLPATTAAGVTYVFVFPIATVVVLFKNRGSFTTPSFRRRFGSLFLPYTVWFWGIVAILESLLVTAALTAAYTIPAASIPALVIVKTVAIILTVMFRPFPRFGEYLVSIFVKFAMVGLLLTASAMVPGETTDRSRSAVIFFLIISAGSAVCVGAVLHRSFLIFRRRRVKSVHPELKQMLAAVCSESGYAAALSWLRIEHKVQGNTDGLQRSLLGLLSVVVEAFLSGNPVEPDQRSDDLLVASVAPGTFSPHIVPHLRYILVRDRPWIFLRLVHGLLSVEVRRNPITLPHGTQTPDSSALFAFLFGDNFFSAGNISRIVESSHFQSSLRFLSVITRRAEEEKPPLIKLSELDDDDDNFDDDF